MAAGNAQVPTSNTDFLDRYEVEAIAISSERLDRRWSSKDDLAEALRLAARENLLESLQRADGQVASPQQQALWNAGPETVPFHLPAIETDEHLLQRSRREDVGMAIAGAGLRWGLELGFALLELEIAEVKAGAERYNRGTEQRARDQRAEGFSALLEKRYEDGFKLLILAERTLITDFTLLRALGAMELRHLEWAAARVFYSRAARTAQSVYPLFAAECRLAASFACRQLHDWEAAYQHSAHALRLVPDFWHAHYEHGINAVGWSQVAHSLTPAKSQQLIQDGAGSLRRLLAHDPRYAIRLGTDGWWTSVRNIAGNLLEELHASLAKDATGSIEFIRNAIVSAEFDCTAERFGRIAAETIAQCNLLTEFYNRGSILDYTDIIQWTPRIQRSLVAIRQLIRRVDEAVLDATRGYNTARQAVPPELWEKLGKPLDERLAALKEQHKVETLTSFKEQEALLPQHRSWFYNFALKRYKILGALMAARLQDAKATSQRLNQTSMKLARAAEKGPFGLEIALLIWLALFGVIRMGLPWGTAFPGLVITIGSAVVSGLATFIFYRVMARRRRVAASTAKKRAQHFDRVEYRPLEMLVNKMEGLMDSCRQEFSNHLPTECRKYLAELKQ